jgi:hypothetical protein
MHERRRRGSRRKSRWCKREEGVIRHPATWGRREELITSTSIHYDELPRAGSQGRATLNPYFENSKGSPQCLICCVYCLLCCAFALAPKGAKFWAYNPACFVLLKFVTFEKRRKSRKSRKTLFLLYIWILSCVSPIAYNCHQPPNSSSTIASNNSLCTSPRV